MRAHDKRKILALKAAVVTTAAVAATFTATSAHAATATIIRPVPGAWAGKCEALLYYDTVGTQAQAEVYQSQTAAGGEICDGWLIRSSDGGATWTTVSGHHNVYTPGGSDYTGWYWDGPGYLTKACVLNAENQGACTAAY